MPPEATTASPLTAEQLAMQATPVAVPEHHPTPPANGGPAETPTPEATPTAQAAPTEQARPTNERRQYQSVESGSDIPVNIDARTRQDIVNRLKKRLVTTQSLQERANQAKKPALLTPIEKMLLASGEATIARLENGEFTEADKHLTLHVIYDELLQKTLFTGQTIREQPGRFHNLRHFPVLWRLSQGPQTQFANADTKFTSLYLEEIRSKGMDPQRLQEDIVRLNQIRLNIEQSLFPLVFRDPLFDQINTSLDPLNMEERTGIKNHNEILHQRNEILAQQYNGRTFLELYQQDPAAALMVQFEANQRALSHSAVLAGELMRTTEKPVISTSAIDEHIIRLGKLPTQEEIAKLQEAATAAKTTTGETEAKVSALRAQLETAEQTVRDRGAAQKKSLYREEAAKNSFGGKIPGLETRLTQLSHELATLDPTIKDKDRASVIQELSRDITKIEEVLKGYREAILTATEKRIDADVDMESAQNHLDRLKDDSARKREVQEAERELAKRVKTQKLAEKAHKDQKEALEKGGTQENKNKANALRAWKRTADDFGAIMEERLAENRFSRHLLGSNSERANGQVNGAEAMREYIFNLVQTGEYNPELARKMLSDETIARAIIWIYKVDPQRVQSPDGRPILETIEGARLNRDALPSEGHDDEKAAYDIVISSQVKALVKALLPNLRGSQFQARDLIQFIITEGVRSAGDGDPYLDLGKSNDYLETQPALRLQAESILRPGTGHAEITDRAVTWDGEVQNSGPRGVNEGDLPFHYRVTTNLNRQGANYEVQVETNLNLLQSLPDTVRRGEVEESIWGTFYDGEGHLRTEIRGIDRRELARMIRERRFIDPRINIPQWIPITGERVENVPPPRTVLPPVTTPTRTLAADRVWANIDSVISPDASDAMAASIANNILQRSPQERLQLLRGGLTPIEVPEVPVTGTTDTEHLNANYRVEFDNGGNIYITNTNTQEKSELNAFYQRRLETYRQSLGIHTLNPDERKKLHDEFLIIQSELGREILRAQQRR